MAELLTFDYYNSIIEVPSPDTSLTMQYLIDQIRDTEDELVPGLGYNKIADASGKDDLGGGVATAITVKLLDNWRVRFQARNGPDTVQCTISGGNLVGGPGGNPIAPSAYTQVLNLSSASGVIATPTTATETTNIQYLLASLGETQKGLGSIFYWDPNSGSDSNTGLTPAAAVATFSKAQSLATAGQHDIIFALASDPTGTTTVTETITITKANLKLKGPGYTFQFKPSSAGSDTIAITADNVEVSGVYLSTASSGTDDAVVIDANNVLVKDCWIDAVQGHGINMVSSDLGVFSSLVIEGCGNSGTGNGIYLRNSSTATVISKCIISDCVNGIALAGSSLADNVIENCLIFNNSAYGVNIGSDVARTTLRSGNTYHNNTSGSTLDNGTGTYIETQAGGASATEIADAVWDEVISAHGTVGTAGKMLKDAKLKATIASLKR